jgi:serine/threonine protein phosphatase 1
MSKALSDKEQKPRLPDGVCVYAISDIHGCANELRNAFAAIDHHLSRAKPTRALHVFLGDYIDRGPQSAQAVDLLIERSKHYECIFLKGNHEAMLFDLLRDPKLFDGWKQYGGLPTLISYGLTPPAKPDVEKQKLLVAALARTIPRHHRHFFNSLKPSYSLGDFFFAHAGVRPGVPLAQQKQQDLLWIRDEFLLSKANFGKFVVHGHTPVPKPDLRPNRINIDTGAYATGILTLLTIQSDHMFAI